MTKKSLLFAVSTFLFCLSIHAQQLPLYAQAPEFHGLINPASVYCDFLTHSRTFSTGFSHRTQWDKLNKISPSTQVLRAEYINLGDRNFVLGAYAQLDRVGITENFGAYGRIAYIFTQGEPEKHGLSVGLNFGAASWRLNTSRLSLAQIDDPNFQSTPAVWYPDIGIGAFWYRNLGRKGKYFYLGASAPRLYEVRNKALTAERYKHIYGLAGVHLPLLEGSAFEASTWTRYVEGIPPQTSVNVRMQILKRVSIGMGLVSTLPKFNDTPFFSFEVGGNIPMGNYILKVNYVNSISTVSYLGNSHELNFSFILNNNDDPEQDD